MAQPAYFRIEHSSFNRGDWGYGRVANAAHYAANQNKRGNVVSVGLPIYPTSYDAQRGFMALEKQAKRKNARLGDTLIVSFPLQVSAAHRLTMMERFLDRITFGGRTYAQAWEHTDHPDNPHFHVVLIDRDRITGKSVGKFGHSRSYRSKQGLEPNVTEWMRKQWEETGNEVFAEFGYSLTFDRRSNLERGLEKAGKHRGYDNDNHSHHTQEDSMAIDRETAAKVADYLEGLDPGNDWEPTEEQLADYHNLLSTSDDVADEDMGELTQDGIGVDPAANIRFLHDNFTNLNHLHRCQERLQDARERYSYLVEQREKAAQVAGEYHQESLPILQNAHIAEERLKDFQRDDGTLKGRSLRIFGRTLYRTGLRKEAEAVEADTLQKQAEARAAEYRRRALDHKVSTLSDQASKAEEAAYMHQEELTRLYGSDEEIGRAESLMKAAIEDTAFIVTLEAAKAAYEEGAITPDEYRTFLLVAGYEAELNAFQDELSEGGESL